MTSGGNEQVVASSGDIKIEAGGRIILPSSAVSTGTELPAFGVSILPASTSGMDAFTLAYPSAGVMKVIQSQSSTAANVYASTDLTVVFGNTTGCVAVFAGSSQAAVFMGYSSSEWMVLAIRGTVAFATSGVT